MDQSVIVDEKFQIDIASVRRSISNEDDVVSNEEDVLLFEDGGLEDEYDKVHSMLAYELEDGDDVDGFDGGFNTYASQCQLVCSWNRYAHVPLCLNTYVSKKVMHIYNLCDGYCVLKQ